MDYLLSGMAVRTGPCRQSFDGPDGIWTSDTTPVQDAGATLRVLELLVRYWRKSESLRPRSRPSGRPKYIRTHLTDYFPIFTPITSPETISSTRRFFWRPAAVTLSATGTSLP